MDEHKQAPQHFANLEEAVTGMVVDSGPEHLTIHDPAVGENIEVRIDDRTRYEWMDNTFTGQFREGARVRVGFYIAGGLHHASEVLILEPGDGAPISTARLEPHVH